MASRPTSVCAEMPANDHPSGSERKVQCARASESVLILPVAQGREQWSPDVNCRNRCCACSGGAWPSVSRRRFSTPAVQQYKRAARARWRGSRLPSLVLGRLPFPYRSEAVDMLPEVPHEWDAIRG